MSGQRKDGTLAMRILCAVFFLIFTTLYLFRYQPDILAVTQHVLSGGATHYNSVIGTVLITLVLWLLQLAIYGWTGLSHRAHALTYLPSLLLLAVLTDISPNLTVGSYLGCWVWLFPLLLIVYAGVVWIFRQLEPMEPTPFSVGVFSRVTWINMLLMCVMALIVCSIGCSDTVFHCRMRMESYMLRGDYKVAVNVGKDLERTDSSLTMLRILALSKTGSLPERLFEFPLTGGSRAMLPNRSSVRLLMLPEDSVYSTFGVVLKEKLSPMTYLRYVNKSPKYASRVSRDWQLCGFLLDRNLDAFVRTLPCYYDIRKPLPKAYREALILYNHLRKKPRVLYKESVMDADYDDFKKAFYSSDNLWTRRANVKGNFGKSYWYYYIASPK